MALQSLLRVLVVLTTVGNQFHHHIFPSTCKHLDRFRFSQRQIPLLASHQATGSSDDWNLPFGFGQKYFSSFYDFFRCAIHCQRFADKYLTVIHKVPNNQALKELLRLEIDCLGFKIIISGSFVVSRSKLGRHCS